MPVLLFAQDGKLRGKVTDNESGEPLIGANVLIEGTQLGASTDVNGEYVILSVPAGEYTVRATYIGYSAMTVSNVRVNSNITTTQEFTLSSTAVQAQEVVIVGDRPMIQRNTTSTVRVNTQENLESLPVRGLQNIVSLEAGVTNKEGTLHVRGGRAGEVAYAIDGANVTNPMFNSQNVDVIQEAIEEVQVQAGGFTAEHGGAASGIIRTTTRTGGTKYQMTVDFQTDDFAKPGEKFLGTTSRGYRNAVATIGGPLGSDKIRFFVAGQHNYLRNDQSMFLSPFKFDSLRQDNLGNYAAGTLLPFGGTVEFKENYLYNNWRVNNQVQGTLLFDMNPFKLKLSGSWENFQNSGGGGWTAGLNNYFNLAAGPRMQWGDSDNNGITDTTYKVLQGRYQMNETNRLFASARLTHVLTNTTFYEVGVAYQSRFAESYDPDMKEEWWKYPDSAANAKLGYYGWTGRYSQPLGYSTIYNFPFAHENGVNAGYGKNKQTAISASVDFTSQINSNWELKAGGGLESWTYRNYGIGSITGYLIAFDANLDGNISAAELSAQGSKYEQRVEALRTGQFTTTGYDYLGNETDGDSYTYNGKSFTVDKPGKPFLANAYIQNKFEYEDLILNVGVRYELFDPNGIKVPQTVNPLTGELDYQDPAFDYNLSILDESSFQEMDPFSLLLPRISFSFPVTDRTVFYALYGKYAQMPRMDLLFPSVTGISGLLNPLRRVPYNLGGSTIGFLMRPERTTQYEIGLRQTLTDNFALTITGFYKDTKDQIQINRLLTSTGSPISTAYLNQDFGTLKGFEMTLELRRTERLAAKVNYTLSDNRGTGSQRRSSQNAVTDEATARFPRFVYPLDFNQTHRGSVLLDYRFAQNDGGPILEGFGINFLMTFNSGHNYTKIAEPQNLGQATVWRIGVRALEDSRNRNPVEPINSSSTPWVFNVDMTISKTFYMDIFNLEVYARVLNLFNTKHILNVYPTTGTPTDDGWLKSPFASSYKALPLYEDFYRAINLENRWAYNRLGSGGGLGGQVGGDIYGSPREIRVGVKLEL
jgi:outer membrane receptor protein involved in Fe transport